MADDHSRIRRALAGHLPVRKPARLEVTRRGVALVVGLVVLLVGSRLGLTDILAMLLAILAGLLWLRFGPPGRDSARDASD